MKDFKKIQKRIVFVAGRKKAEGIDGFLVNFAGSGFIIDSKKVITAAHVVKQLEDAGDEVEIFVGIYKSEQSNITEYKHVVIDKKSIILSDDSSFQKDVAILPLPETESETFSEDDLLTNNDDYEAGQDVYALGFPLANEFFQTGVGLTLFVTKSIIAAPKYNGDRKDIDFILIDQHINPAASGSPLLRAGDNKILGLLAGTFHNTVFQNVAAEQMQVGGQPIQIPRNIGLVRPAKFIKETVNGAS